MKYAKYNKNIMMTETAHEITIRIRRIQNEDCTLSVKTSLTVKELKELLQTVISDSQ